MNGQFVAQFPYRKFGTSVRDDILQYDRLFDDALVSIDQIQVRLNIRIRD